MIDLSTTYLGLKLKNPLVASASPFPKKLDNIRRMEAAGLAAIVLHSLFEEQITFESNELDHFLNAGTESFAEALTYFPDLAHYNMGPEPYLELIRKARAAGDHPGHRFAQRNFHRRLGGVRPQDRAGRRQRARIEHVLPVHRPEPERRRIGRGICAAGARRPRQSPDPPGGEAEPVLFGAAADGPAACRGRSGRAGTVQPLLPARFRPRGPLRRAPPQAQHVRRPAPAVALDRHSPRPGPGGFCAEQRRAHRAGSDQGDDGRRERGHDHLRPSCRTGWSMPGGY